MTGGGKERKRERGDDDDESWGGEVRDGDQGTEKLKARTAMNPERQS